MSTQHSGPADPPNLATDTGEWRSQQGVTLGYVAALEQIMAQFAEFYIPEYEVAGKRLHTVWRRGGTPQNPIVIAEDPALQPNWFVGEQYKSLNYAPQSIHFFRSGGTHQIAPTPMIGNHRTGYRQLYAIIYSITTRITSFDDDDGQELFNFLIAAIYRQTHGSVLNAVGESLVYLPKIEDGRGTTMEFQLKIGVPIFEPPLIPVCVQSASVKTEILHGQACP